MTNQSKRSVLVTGGAGFIGSHLIDSLLADNYRVVAFDNFNDFYDPKVKRRNIEQHLQNTQYNLIEGDIRNPQDVRAAFAEGPFETVVHLAAMAGVRPSLQNPALYMDVNVMGTQRIVDELLKSSPQARLVFGSSSSVYGARSGERFSEGDRVDQPLSPYAASKLSNEVQLYSIHHTTGLPVVCLRFFTVYGPRQRPDLAIHKFCHAIDEGRTIEVFGDGQSKRDYTFVADIISGVRSAMTFDLATGYEIMNLGRSEPVYLMEMIRGIEQALGKQAKIEHKPFQTGDMPYTYADIEKARRLLGYNPRTTFADGVQSFVQWYKAKDKSSPMLVG